MLQFLALPFDLRMGFFVHTLEFLCDESVDHDTVTRTHTNAMGTFTYTFTKVEDTYTLSIVLSKTEILTLTFTDPKDLMQTKVWGNERIIRDLCTRFDPSTFVFDENTDYPLELLADTLIAEGTLYFEQGIARSMYGKRLF